LDHITDDRCDSDARGAGADDEIASVLCGVSVVQIFDRIEVRARTADAPIRFRPLRRLKCVVVKTSRDGLSEYEENRSREPYVTFVDDHVGRNVESSQCSCESVGRARVTTCARGHRCRCVVVDIGSTGEERVEKSPVLARLKWLKSVDADV
jgi:hypothetical protein